MEIKETIFKPDFSNENIDYSLPRISITECLNMLETPFDKEGVAQKTYEKNFNNPESKYYQMTVEQIIEAWEEKGAESCKYGSLLDDYIGNIFTGTDKTLELWKLDNGYEWDQRLNNLCKSFDEFYNILNKSGNTIFIDREKTVYYKYGNYMIKGRLDALFYNIKTKKWIIVDWKSSGTIDIIPTRWTKKMLGPLYNYPQLNYYRYTLQLHYYKKALLESGYLPSDVKADDIEVMIVSLPGHEVEGSGFFYKIYKEAFPYNGALLDNLFKFAIQKKQLENTI